MHFINHILKSMAHYSHDWHLWLHCAFLWLMEVYNRMWIISSAHLMWGLHDSNMDPCILILFHYKTSAIHGSGFMAPSCLSNDVNNSTMIRPFRFLDRMNILQRVTRTHKLMFLFKHSAKLSNFMLRIKNLYLTSTTSPAGYIITNCRDMNKLIPLWSDAGKIYSPTNYILFRFCHVYNTHMVVYYIQMGPRYHFRKVSNIRRTWGRNKVVYQSDVVGASRCRRCSNYIFILNLTPGFNGLGKDNCKTSRETLMFGDWVRLILENWRYINKKTYEQKQKTQIWFILMT